MPNVGTIIKKCIKYLRIRRTKAISVVLTTMIILVASVVLATGVVIYGTSLFQTGTLQEVIEVKGIKLWVNATDTDGVAWGAVGVRNSGDKLVSVDQIIVRGTSVPFTQWYVDKNQTAVTTENYQSQFVENNNDANDKMKDSAVLDAYPGCPAAGATVLKMDFDGAGGKKSLCLQQATGPISLSPGERLIAYYRVPDGIIVSVDSGLPTNVGIFAGKTGAPITAIISNL